MTEPAGREVWRARGRVLVGGMATGPALVLDAPLSLWGGLELASGQIVDARHPQRGASIAGTILALPGGRGSSSSSSVLAEALRRGTGPAGIVMPRADGIIVIGALVVQLLDGLHCPVLELSPADYRRLATGDLLALAADGSVVATPAGALT